MPNRLRNRASRSSRRALAPVNPAPTGDIDRPVLALPLEPAPVPERPRRWWEISPDER